MNKLIRNIKRILSQNPNLFIILKINNSNVVQKCQTRKFLAQWTAGHRLVSNEWVKVLSEKKNSERFLSTTCTRFPELHWNYRHYTYQQLKRQTSPWINITPRNSWECPCSHEININHNERMWKHFTAKCSYEQ